jgi:hypothetical protein
MDKIKLPDGTSYELVNGAEAKVMTNRILALVACAVLVQGIVSAQQARHPDLSGVWSYAIDRAPARLKKEVNGQVTIQKIDQSARHGDASTERGVPAVHTASDL